MGETECDIVGDGEDGAGVFRVGVILIEGFKIFLKLKGRVELLVI